MPTLDWIGKKAVVNHHREVPYHVLRCDPELSVGDPGSGNLLVHGDNLLALKALLPYYAGKVKCIYIDPPYNTGNEGWVYNDNSNAPEIREWLGKVVGKEAEDLSRHDKWLCMMYPRLRVLRDFLTEDGMIFVSADEYEHRHLALLMDEVFGASNRVETLVWKKSYGGGAKSKHIVNVHEYVECFARDKAKIGTLTLPPDPKILKYYKYEDDKVTSRGPFRLQPLATNSMDERENLRYPIPHEGEEIWPEKQWQWAKERAFAALENDELVIKKTRGKWSVNYKQYLRDAEGEERRSKMYSIIEGVYTQHGTGEIKDLFGDGKVFAFPKPSELVKAFIQLASNGNDLILDSFAGSGTTGHAVMSANSEDGCKRRFVLIEMEEQIAEPITRQRLKKVIEGTEATDGGDADENQPHGFRFCRLGPTLLDADGQIATEVKFDDLARHTWFCETGEPWPRRGNGRRTPLLGTLGDTAVYLLFNGVLGDRTVKGGNVLTSKVLASLPKHNGPKVIYGEASRLGRERLKREKITFKQIPYEVKGV